MDCGRNTIGRHRLRPEHPGSSILRVPGSTRSTLPAPSTSSADGFESGERQHVVTFGAEMAVLASRDERYRDAVNGADLVVPDTIGIVWRVSSILAGCLPERVAGIDLVERVLAATKRAACASSCLGATAGVAESAAQTLATRYRGVGTRACITAISAPITATTSRASCSAPERTLARRARFSESRILDTRSREASSVAPCASASAARWTCGPAALPARPPRGAGLVSVALIDSFASPIVSTSARVASIRHARVGAGYALRSANPQT